MSATSGCTTPTAIAPDSIAADTRPSSAGVVDQHTVEPLNELLERFVFGQQPDDDGVELQGARRTAALNGQVDDPVSSTSRACGPVVLRLGCLQRLLQPAEFALGECDDDLFFGPELVVDSRFRDPDGIGDHLQRGPADAVLGDQPQRGIQDARLRGAAL